MGEGKPATKPLCSLGSCGQLLWLLWPLVPNFPKQSRLSFMLLPPPLSAFQDHRCARALSWFTLQTPRAWPVRPPTPLLVWRHGLLGVGARTGCVRSGANVSSVLCAAHEERPAADLGGLPGSCIGHGACR